MRRPKNHTFGVTWQLVKKVYTKKRKAGSRNKRLKYIHILYMHMVKIISLSDAAYSTLKKVKGKRSFSEAILSIFRPKANLLEVFGKWPGPKEELHKIEKVIAENRRKFKLKDVSF